MKFITALKIFAGFVALAVGGIGVFVPVLPTTPFVLLSIGCFSSSPNIRQKILKIKFVNEYYNGYTKKVAIRKRTIIFSLIFLWVTLGLSMFFVNNIILIIVLSCIGATVSAHLIYMALRKKKTIVNTIDQDIDSNNDVSEKNDL